MVVVVLGLRAVPRRFAVCDGAMDQNRRIKSRGLIVDFIACLTRAEIIGELSLDFKHKNGAASEKQRH